MNELNLSNEIQKSVLEAQNIEEQLKTAVEKSIKITIEEARFFFKDESEIHGYLRSELKHQFKESGFSNKTDLILRECNSNLCYYKKSGVDNIYNFVKFESPERDELCEQGYKPGSARFDIVIWKPDKDFFPMERIPIPKPLAGIEVKRQRAKDGNGKPIKKEDFVKDIIKDCAKLTDPGNEVKYKYVLIILYHPKVFTLDIEKEFSNYTDKINFYYLEVNHEYLFRWDRIPGRHEKRFYEFLQNFGVNCNRNTTKIETIDEFSKEIHNCSTPISLRLDKDFTKAYLIIGDKAWKFIVKFGSKGEIKLYKDNTKYYPKDGGY